MTQFPSWNPFGKKKQRPPIGIMWTRRVSNTLTYQNVMKPSCWTFPKTSSTLSKEISLINTSIKLETWKPILATGISQFLRSGNFWQILQISNWKIQGYLATINCLPFMIIKWKLILEILVLIWLVSMSMLLIHPIWQTMELLLLSIRIFLRRLGAEHYLAKKVFSKSILMNLNLEPSPFNSKSLVYLILLKFFSKKLLKF